MVVGVGIDVVAIGRISRALAEAAGDFEAAAPVFRPAPQKKRPPRGGPFSIDSRHI